MIVYLEITSWAGMLIAAEHYYGELRCSSEDTDKRVAIERILSASQARKLSKKDGWTYEEGARCVRFTDKDTIRGIAIYEYKDHFPKAVGLIEGSPIYTDPQYILDGFSFIKNRCNALYDRAIEIGWYENDERAMEEISNKWNKLIDSVKEKDNDS